MSFRLSSVFPPFEPGPLLPGMQRPYEKICGAVNTKIHLTYIFFPRNLRRPNKERTNDAE